MKILVCGGAGYIGSHMCKRLARAGHVPIAFDNLSTGHEWAVKWGPLVRADLLDPAALANVFREHPIDAVMHFAARSIVSESMREPGLYFRNNVAGTLNLLDAMREGRVGKFVFSSTAAVYGNPQYTPIDEAHPCAPINPYGWSKFMAERVIEEFCRAHGMRAVSLRYFNAAGADPDGEVGEAHEPETHLIPNVIRAAIDPSAGPVKVFGNDYETPDGTCIRDYIHVDDLCDAHLLALDLLSASNGFRAFNLGCGQGYSVAQVLAACRARCDGGPEAEFVERRPGDPPSLVASSAAAASTLGWKPSRSLADCVASALAWHRGMSS
ncbi:MAG TPA: UDP-glucose 4-epimerase GalE [Rudaea sp.]|nr:UDP-glucose 4-epimerase GalE [Rudaea sp.]